MATAQQPPVATPLPCLVFDHGDEHHTSTIYSVSDGTHRPGDGICELLRGNKLSWVTSHSWVLVWDVATLATYLWNPHGPHPHNNNRIHLPPLAEPPAEAGCVLSSKPTDPGGCTVLLAARTSNLMWYCRVGDPAASSWARHEYDVGSVRVPAGYPDHPTKQVMYRLASCRGRFYYQRPSDEIGVLELSPGGKPAFSVLPMKGPRLVPVGGYVAAASPYLLDLGGELYQVYVFFRNVDFDTIDDVGVYRLDFQRKEAVRVDGIGGRAILLGATSAFAGWCPASAFGLLPNSVYWMSPENGCLHVYDLEHKTEEMREPCRAAGTKPSSSTSFWMLPAHHT